MSVSGVGTSYALKGSREDKVLVQECLLGSEEAWSELIDKYKSLIYSIPIKQGISPEDSAEIFQAVCFTLLRELSHLREPRALAAWLIKLTSRKCSRWKREKQIYVNLDLDQENVLEAEQLPSDMLQDLEREQMVREVLADTAPVCRRLIDLLFFRNPPLRYDEAAQILGLAKGSIGATRMRCLEKLRRSLEKKGFR